MRVRAENVRYRDISESLRRRILAGEWAPGGRLPTRRELVREFSSNLVTMQRALSELTSEKFIEARGRAGTFVVGEPPHLCDFGLVFQDPEEQGKLRSRFYETIRQVAQGYRGPITLHSFIGVSPRLPGHDLARLTKLVKGHRIAGLIFTTNPFELEGTSILNEPGIPRVAVMTEPVYPGIPVVSPESGTFLERALDRLQRLGRQKPAILFSATDLYDIGPAMAAARGLALPPSRMMRIFPDFPVSARDAVRLLFSGNPAERPDSLVLNDDHFVEEATAGFLEAGVQASDIEVIAHANFPNPPRALIPVTFLGTDVHALVAACFDLCDRQRKGQAVPDLTRITARFANELPEKITANRGTAA